MDTQDLQREIQYDVKKGEMRRFHRHIVNFSNEAILAYLKAGINAKKTYRDDTPMQTAIACGNIEAVFMLIQHGISIQKHDLEYAQKDTTRNILSFMFKSMGIRA